MVLGQYQTFLKDWPEWFHISPWDQYLNSNSYQPWVFYNGLLLILIVKRIGTALNIKHCWKVLCSLTLDIEVMLHLFFLRRTFAIALS